VVVVGGGEMAIDCVRTALRSGAGEVVCVYRRDAAQLTCSQADYQSALEEGAVFQFLVAPVAVVGGPDGRVKGLRLVRTELGPPEPDGRQPYRVRAGTEFEIAADWVLTALGFEPMPLPEDSLFGGLARSDQGGLWVDDRQMTRQPGVFAGGELVRGPSSILEVVRDARRAAEGIHGFLQPRAA
jgi:glutamate synthase (NADPH) small chain